MVDLVPPPGWRSAMTISATELLGWYDIARRESQPLGLGVRPEGGEDVGIGA